MTIVCFASSKYSLPTNLFKSAQSNAIAKSYCSTFDSVLTSSLPGKKSNTLGNSFITTSAHFPNAFTAKFIARQLPIASPSGVS